MINLAEYANKKICVALSGGKDSMALAHYLFTYGRGYNITLSAMNCNHKIRGEESEKDSEFVQKWCNERNIPLAFFEWNDAADNKSENAARAWRMKCYQAAIMPSCEYFDVKYTAIYSNEKWQGADAVATAHHLDDNAETVLFNLARGSGLSGLEGITDMQINLCEKPLKLIRPFISLTREEIDDYILKNNIPYVEDSTNASNKYTRNLIRHSVLPELEKAVNGARRAIYRFSRLAAEYEEYFDKIIKEKKLIKNTRLGFEIAHCAEKVIFKMSVVKALNMQEVKDYTSTHVQKLYELQFAEVGKKFEFLGFVAFKDRNKITVCNSELLNITDDGLPFKEYYRGEYSFYFETFLRIVEGKELKDNLLALESAIEDDKRLPKKFKHLKFDGQKIPPSAVIRYMKEGDKFKKFGGGTKNLGDFFTDKKIPLSIRKHVPLIVDGSEVLVVGGVEISEDVKIVEQTKNILYIICEDFTI